MTFPTIHFLGSKMLVSGRVTTNSPRENGVETETQTHLAISDPVKKAV